MDTKHNEQLCDLPAVTQAELIRSKAISPVELIDSCLSRIETVQSKFNPFTLVLDEEARRQARIAEKQLMRDKVTGPLHGLPLGIKDFTPTKGHRTTRGSVTHKDWIPDQNPVIVNRLLNAGGIILAKTTTPEFAYSSFTQSRLWGVTRNPWDLTKTSGGSSGGSAVAVTTGCVSIAEGTDMGGSIRIPAALCGCVGLKPSHGRIPMDILGTVFDDISHFGPLARTVDDATLFLQITEGPDDADIQSQRHPASLDSIQNIEGKLANLRVAISPDLGFYDVHPDILENLYEVANSLSNADANVETVDLDWPSEFATSWFDYWGVYLAAGFGHLLDKHENVMDPELVHLIRQGQNARAVDIELISHIRTQQWRKMAKLFEHYDVLICPTMALPAPSANAKDSDFDNFNENGKLQGLDMTAIFNNVAACPVVAIPSGFTQSGLPTSVQVVGKRFDDPTVLAVARCIEKYKPWKQWASKD